MTTNTKKYQIALHGCDDTTYFEIEVTDEELKFLRRLEKLSEENSDYQCQPTLQIEEL